MSGVVGRAGTKSGVVGKETTLAPPVGTLISVPWGASAVEGFIYCNGGSYNTYTYRNLHTFISNTYGGTAYAQGVTDAPGASTTFQVPDFRGRFLRGDGGDANAIGTAQGSQNDYELSSIWAQTPHTGNNHSGYNWGVPGLHIAYPLQSWDTSYPDNYGAYYYPVWRGSFGNIPIDSSSNTSGTAGRYGKGYNEMRIPIGVGGEGGSMVGQAHSGQAPSSSWANSEGRPVNFAVKWFIKWSEV